MRRRLFWALFGMAALSTVLVAVGAIGIVNSARFRATRTELTRAGQVIAELVAERGLDGARVAALIGGDRVERITDELAVVRRAAGGSDLAFVAVTPAGRVVARPAVAALGIDPEALLAGETVPIGGRRAGFVGVAVPVPGDTDGTRLAVVLSRSVPVELSVPAGPVAAVLVVVAVLSLLLARVIASGLTRRLSTVAAAARALSVGDLGARAPVEGADELAELEKAFNEMAVELEASRGREREFLLAVGHDLRTPLTTIAGYAEALADGVDDPAETARIGSVLEVEAGRLGRLIEDIALLARIDSSEFGLRPGPVDVAALVGDLSAPYADRAAAARVRLVVDGTVSGPRMLDADRIGQILSNLLDNALRYTPEAATVTVTCSGDAENVVLSVSDSGPGIEPEDLPHVFERFYVARRYRGVRPEGSGLGLSVVERLVAAMGGSVEVDSALGVGTTFRVTIPAPRSP